MDKLILVSSWSYQDYNYDFALEKFVAFIDDFQYGHIVHSLKQTCIFPFQIVLQYTIYCLSLSSLHECTYQ